MLSRIADSLFWLGRYVERAEDTARILDVNYHLILEQSQHPQKFRWDPLVIMAGEEDRFRQLHRDATARNVFEFLAFAPNNPSSIVQCIARARENARTIRDRISREMWEDINGLFHTVSRFSMEEELASGPHRFCEKIKFGTYRFRGVTDATMPHDEGWDFLRVGFALERAEMTARLVDVQHRHRFEDSEPAAGAENHQWWMALVKSVGAYETYHRYYHSAVDPIHAAEMLILNPQHPRSIRFSMQEVQAGLRAISGTGTGAYANEAERLTGKVLERLRYDLVDEIFRQGLHSYVHELLRMCDAIGEDIARTYFYYAVVA